MVHFDWSINLGTLIALGVMLFTFYRFHITNVRARVIMEYEVKDMKHKVNQMWTYFQRRFNIDWSNGKEE